MSLRGVKKALYRTPHQFFGSKSVEDEQLKQWEYDIHVAIAGLDYLKIQDQKWNKYWIEIVTNFIEVIDTFRDLHKPFEGIQSDDTSDADSDEEFTNITTHELKEASKLAKILFERVSENVKENSITFNSKCDEMKSNLKAVDKLIIKRNHKKIDYDMQYKIVESLLKGSNSADKDKSKLEQSQTKMGEIKIIYADLCEKVKLVIPEVLATLSEFINKLTMKFYFSNYEILDLINRNITKFAKIQGIIRSAEAITYEHIIADFGNTYTQAQNKLESLVMLKDYRSLQNKNLTEKTVEQVNNVAGTVVDTTMNITSTLYTRASKPNQKMSLSLKSIKLDNPVRPYKKEGLFKSATDPLEFINNEYEVKDLANSSSKSPLRFNGFKSKEDPIGSNSPTEENINENREPETPTSEAFGTDWLRPLSLKNTTLPMSVESSPNVEKKHLQSSDLHSDILVSEMTEGDVENSTTTPKSRVSSLNIENNTDTYKYVNVRMESIKNKIFDIVTKPNIDCAPVTVQLESFEIIDERFRERVEAQGTIAANAFKLYLSV